MDAFDVIHATATHNSVTCKPILHRRFLDAENAILSNWDWGDGIGPTAAEAAQIVHDTYDDAALLTIAAAVCSYADAEYANHPAKLREVAVVAREILTTIVESKPEDRVTLS